MDAFDIVIREIKTHTNIACANDPHSWMPVFAKMVIRFLESIREE